MTSDLNAPLRPWSSLPPFALFRSRRDDALPRLLKLPALPFGMVDVLQQPVLAILQPLLHADDEQPDLLDIRFVDLLICGAIWQPIRGGP